MSNDIKYYAINPLTKEIETFDKDFIFSTRVSSKTYIAGEDIIFDRKQHMVKWNGNTAAIRYVNVVGAIIKGLIWTTTPELSEEWELWLMDNPRRITELRRNYIQ